MDEGVSSSGLDLVMRMMIVRLRTHASLWQPSDPLHFGSDGGYASEYILVLSAQSILPILILTEQVRRKRYNTNSRR